MSEPKNSELLKSLEIIMAVDKETAENFKKQLIPLLTKTVKLRKSIMRVAIMMCLVNLLFLTLIWLFNHCFDWLTLILTIGWLFWLSHSIRKFIQARWELKKLQD